MGTRDIFAHRYSVVVVEEDSGPSLYLRDILAKSGDFNCIGCFSSAARALAEIPALHPDLVLMDIGLPGMNGIQCTRVLKRSNPELKIVIFTSHHEASFIERSIEAGANGYLIKPVSVDQCLVALKFALGRIDVKRIDSVEKVKPSPLLEQGCSLLTPRENEVMLHLAEGLPYKEIADKMGFSFSSVHKHQHKIFKKLRVTNRTEAIRKWQPSRADNSPLPESLQKQRHS